MVTIAAKYGLQFQMKTFLQLAGAGLITLAIGWVLYISVVKTVFARALVQVRSLSLLRTLNDKNETREVEATVKALMKSSHVDLMGEDVPRYPPFVKGLPGTPLTVLLQSQAELIRKIQVELSFNEQEFEKLVMPLIVNYAKFVHLLPASEAHHHRGAGGLFRHGLEVAYWAAHGSTAVIFGMGDTPRGRRNDIPRWRLACCIAGMLHDIGKPISDVAVSSRDGSTTWNPYVESLQAWVQRNNLDRYFLRWKKQRHNRHTTVGVSAIKFIIPETTSSFIFLGESGIEIIEAMHEAISGFTVSKVVSRVVIDADKTSVMHDLRQSNIEITEFNCGVPVERYCLDAMRRLIGNGKWAVNELGATVWNLKQGLFIIWKSTSDITAMLEVDNVPGIPRDPDALAEILLERGLAVECEFINENNQTAKYRYWEVLPDLLNESGLREPILMLKLASPELLFVNEPPVAITGFVHKDPNNVVEAAGIETQPETPQAGEFKLPAQSESDAWSDIRHPPAHSVLATLAEDGKAVTTPVATAAGATSPAQPTAPADPAAVTSKPAEGLGLLDSIGMDVDFTFGEDADPVAAPAAPAAPAVPGAQNVDISNIGVSAAPAPQN